jgi:outer membrane protein OmpA-like peptidoglycan-associated protein
MSKWYAVPFLAAFVVFPGRMAQADQGAPSAMPAPDRCPDVKVHFDTNSSDLSLDNKAILDHAATCLKSNQRLRVSVIGRADVTGKEDFNQKLSEKRAEAVSSYLSSQGVATNQMATVGYGDSRPVCNGDDEDCLARNRQTAIRATCHL